MPLRRVVLVVLLLPVAGYLIWDQVESRALRRDIAAIAARGEPIAIDEVPVGGDTPERRDAARIYAAAAERAREIPPELRLNVGSKDVDGPNAPSLAELEASYRPDAPVLQLADQAAPLDFNGFGDVELVSEDALSLVSVLAALRADLYSARGRGDDAATSLVSAARVQRALDASLFRWMSTSRILGSVRIMLRHTSPSEVALSRLQDAVAELPDADTLRREVERRRASLIDEWSRPRAGISEAILLRLLRPWIARSQRGQLAALQDSLAVAREPWPGRVAAGKALERKYEPELRAMTAGRGWLARLAVPYGKGVAALNITWSGQYVAAHRVLLATLAIERYRRAHGGAAPETLSALVPTYLSAVPVDPFSGASLVYRRAADHYLIYSVDLDTNDDAGLLYGLGSKGQLNPLRGMPRDLGLRVEIAR